MRVSLADSGSVSVVLRHSTTVSLSLTLAVNLKVEVMFAVPLVTVPTLVRVARKSKSSHCTGDEVSLHATILGSGLLAKNRATVGSVRFGVAVQETETASVTVQV